MATEDEHLARLRRSADAMKDRSGDDQVRDEAIRALLDIAISHHEQLANTLRKDEPIDNGNF